jgi:hypothetical protein
MEIQWVLELKLQEKTKKGGKGNQNNYLDTLVLDPPYQNKSQATTIA